MYNSIDGVRYTQYNQKILERLHRVFEDKPVFWGQILHNEMLMTCNDYALFLAFYDKFGRTGNVHQVVHLGENCLYRIMCTWEHIAFFLHNLFHKYMYINQDKNNTYISEKEISLNKVILCLIENATDIEDSIYERFNLINNLYVCRNNSRSIRNIATHRYHTGVLFVNNKGKYKSTSIATSEALYKHVDKINKELDMDFKNIFMAIKEYHEIEKWYISAMLEA